MKTRVVLPELLETYPNDHPAAIAGRRDLLLVNNIMGNHRWMIRSLGRRYQPGWRITEIGAGDGALSLRLWQSGLCPASALHAFDLVDQPADWPGEAEWTRGNIFEQPLPDSEVLVANLFLHHFKDDQLHLLGSRISPRTRLIIAAEPARYRIHSILGRMLCSLARFHPITRHDMQVSIRAGFRGVELDCALRLGPEWQCQSATCVKGAYHFLATRAPPNQ